MSAESGRRIKVLSVNDEDYFQQLVGEHLERAGHEIVLARDGVEGFQTALRELPDLILMNYMMPRLDGALAAAKLREYPHFRDTPIILNSICDRNSVAAGLGESGCTDFLQLPCSMREIDTLIAIYCSGNILGR